MSDKTDQKRKPLMTCGFDEFAVMTLKAEPNPQAKIKPPPNENAPLLTVEADEMTEFVVNAISAKDLATQTGTT